jgi:type IV pilus assembly protein PilP
MYKIYCYTISILLGLTGVVCFSGDGHAADVPDVVRYISNRIKIERPDKIVQPADMVSPASVPEEAEPKIAEAEASKPVIAPPADSGKEGVQAGVKMPEEKSETALREEVAALIGKKEQFYSRTGRIDPFEPFLRKPEPDVVSDEDRMLERRIPRTPLEKIDLSQLQLTGVLRTSTTIRAMVQDGSGKGYMIGEGTYMGNKGGQVTRILKDRVVVEEKYLDVFGKIAVRERELKLQQ